MGTSDVLTAEYFSSAVGVSSVEISSIRKSASFEGKVAEFGQENISTQKRNLLNADEILRLPSKKLLVIIRGNNPILLDKVIYKEHKVAKNLIDSPVSEYIPEWDETNIQNTTKKSEKVHIETKNSSHKGFKFY